MCCYPFKIDNILLHSRVIGNSILAIEFIAITAILFQNFDSELLKIEHGAPWVALFMLILSNVSIFSNFQDMPLIFALTYYIYYKSESNSDINYFRCCKSLELAISQTAIVFLINMGFRIWTTVEWIRYYYEPVLQDLFSTKFQIILISTSSVLLLVIGCVILYGIVEFFICCVPKTKKCCENLKQQRIKHEKQINLDRVKSLEEKNKEYEAKLAEISQKNKMTTHNLEETKLQLEKTKTQLHEAKQHIVEDDNNIQVAVVVTKDEDN